MPNTDSSQLRIAHFSAGASSAVAALLGKSNKLVYAETGSEHQDNQRFIADFERHTGMTVARLKSEKYADTWECWEGERFLAGPHGAPCSRHLKIKVLEPVERIPGAVHIFGYTIEERHRAERLARLKPDLRIECPLIDSYITSAGARQILIDLGINPPITYEMGLPHANCIPCSKATSPGYWALIREIAPDKFKRIAEMDRRFGARLVRIRGERYHLDELPDDIKPSTAEAPSCDLLCEIAKGDIPPA